MPYGALTYHLGLKVPTAKQGQKGPLLTVDGQDMLEEDSKVVLFDASYRHYAVNDTDEERIILYLDFALGELGNVPGLRFFEKLDSDAESNGFGPHDNVPALLERCCRDYDEGMVLGSAPKETAPIIKKKSSDDGNGDGANGGQSEGTSLSVSDEFLTAMLAKAGIEQ
jgi:hypothetical protein